MLEPHHDGSPLYVSNLSPELGETVRVRLRVPESLGPVRAVRVRSNPNREPRLSTADRLHAADGWVWWEAEILIENPVHGYRFLVRLDDGTDFWVNARGVFRIETLDSEDFKLTTHPPAPAWAESTVMYQVFPDRFARSAAADDREAPEWAIPAEWTDAVDLVPPARSSQLYGGDLDGIVERLDHLERLGVTMLYLTPVFPGRSNHRYDAANFDAVDPLLGGNEALARLTDAVHARGLT
ncbi:MAG: alpha-amylase family glycosyl hydrolase, partial [Mycetocola sp.]